MPIHVVCLGLSPHLQQQMPAEDSKCGRSVLLSNCRWPPSFFAVCTDRMACVCELHPQSMSHTRSFLLPMSHWTQVFRHIRLDLAAGFQTRGHATAPLEGITLVPSSECACRISDARPNECDNTLSGETRVRRNTFNESPFPARTPHESK